MEFKPNGTKVLIEPLQENEVIHGKIIVENQTRRSQKGIVITCGMKEDGSPMHFTPGDKVMFSSVAGSNLELNGKAYLLLRQEEIWGTLVDYS